MNESIRSGALAVLASATVAAGAAAVGAAAVPNAFADEVANDPAIEQVDQVDRAVEGGTIAGADSLADVEDRQDADEVQLDEPLGEDGSANASAEESSADQDDPTIQKAPAPQETPSNPEYVSDSSMPASFDLRRVAVLQEDGTVKYMSFVTPIKQQGPWGSCWAFASIAAAESSIMYEAYQEGVVIPEKFLTDGWLDLSEKHLAWFVYNPLGRDSAADAGYTSQVGEGEHRKDASDAGIYDSGGLMFFASTLFASGTGVMPEYLYPYENDERIPSSNGRYWSDKGGWAIDELERFGYALQIEESNIFDSPADVVNSPDSFSDPSSEFTKRINAFKNEIMNGRAVSIAFMADTSQPGQIGEARYISENYAHYTYEAAGSNHAVTIVGWDDDYAVENFGVKSAVDPESMDSEDGPRPYDEPRVPDSWRPPAKGAWLVKNSWGASGNDFPNKGDWGVDEDGDGMGDGYFWLSYYDKSITMPETFDFAVSDLVNDKREGYINNQHDFMPHQVTLKLSADQIMNVFTADHDQEIRALTCVTYEPDLDVTYKLIKLNDGDSLEDALARKSAETTVHYDQSGFHILNLDKSKWCQLEEGDRFVVIASMKRSDGSPVAFLPQATSAESYQDAIEDLKTNEKERNNYREQARMGLINKYSNELIKQGIYGDDYREALDKYMNDPSFEDEVQIAFDKAINGLIEEYSASWTVGVVNPGESYLSIGGALMDLVDAIRELRTYNGMTDAIDNFGLKAYGYYDKATEDERAALETALEEAESLLRGVVASADGTDVPRNKLWVTQEAYDLVADFIRHAAHHLGKPALADYMVEIDLDMFTHAKPVFLASMKHGEMDPGVDPNVNPSAHAAEFIQGKSVLAQTADDMRLLLAAAGAVLCALPVLASSLFFRRRRGL